MKYRGGGKQTSFASSSLCLDIGNNPVDTGNDTSGGTTTIVSQNLDGDDVDGLCNTVCGSTDGTSDVGSMSEEIRVGRARDSVESPGGTAAKLSVCNQNTGVDNVGKDASSSTAIIDVAGTGSALVRDGAKTP